MDDSIDSERNINDESNAHQSDAENIDDNADGGGQCHVNNSTASVAVHNTVDRQLLMRPKDSIHKCQSDPSNRSSMPANTSRSHIQSRSLRFPSTSTANNPMTGATTRKCMFTLDGYNYVIGKRNHTNTLPNK